MFQSIMTLKHNYRGLILMHEYYRQQIQFFGNIFFIELRIISHKLKFLVTIA